MIEAHNHTGSPGDGPKIKTSDLDGPFGNNPIYIPATEWLDAARDATATLANTQLDNYNTSQAAIEFVDPSNGTAVFTFRIPEKFGQIDKIELLYDQANASSKDLYLRTHISRLRIGEAVVTEDTGPTAIAANANALDAVGDLSILTIPATSHDALYERPGDIISVLVNRQANNALDTYDTAWMVYGALITFTKR